MTQSNHKHYDCNIDRRGYESRPRADNNGFWFSSNIDDWHGSRHPPKGVEAEPAKRDEPEKRPWYPGQKRATFRNQLKEYNHDRTNANVTL
jgi:hypothetical protein